MNKIISQKTVITASAQTNLLKLIGLARGLPVTKLVWCLVSYSSSIRLYMEVAGFFWILRALAL